MTESTVQFHTGETQISLHQRALHYILEVFRSNPDIRAIDYGFQFEKNWEEKLIQTMFDKSKIKMRMYGSAKELLENLTFYADCPGVDRYFNLELLPYFSTPMTYENLSGQKYMCKSDLFVMLQSMIQKANSLETLLVVTIVSFFLKSKESLLKNVEFVPFVQKVFDGIANEIPMVHKEMREVAKHGEFYRKFLQELPKLGFEELFAQLKSYIPNNWSDLESERIKVLLWKFENSPKLVPILDPQTFAKGRALSFVQARVIIERLDEIIKKRPEMFLPNSGETPVTVRLFEDGDKKFVMKAELFGALKLPVNHEKDFYIETIPFEEVLRKFKIKNIDFIRFPIRRTKHRAVPIPGVHPEDPRNFCILAVDALFEHLRSFILGHRLFETCQFSDWTQVQGIFHKYQEGFTPDRETPYFLRSVVLDNMNCSLRSLGTEMIPTNAIRNARKDGFTVQNLKNELTYLNLTGLFPEIQDHAEVVYAHVDRVKKEKYLRTCDLMDAVEYCQLICFFERLPKYKRFLHNQGGCGRVPGLKCTLCDEKKTKLEDQKDALKLEGSETSAVKSSSQTILMAYTSPKNPDFKSSKVLKVTDSEMEASDTQLTELNTKIASLEAQLASQSEKSTQLESDLLKATQEHEELQVSNIKLQSESEANKGVISQLIDKLSIKGTMKESAICLN